MKVEIIICIILILGAIFANQIDKLNIAIFGQSRFNWEMENKKLEKIINILGRVILFCFASAGLIYTIFFDK